MSYQFDRRGDGSPVVTSGPSRRMRIFWWAGVVGINLANSAGLIAGLERAGWLTGLVIAADIALVLLTALLMVSSQRLVIAGSTVTVSQTVRGAVLRDRCHELPYRSPRFVCVNSRLGSVVKMDGLSWVRLDGTGLIYGKFLEPGEAQELADRLNSKMASALG